MRIFSILHLCFVFSVICWILAIPYTEDLYHHRNLQNAYNIVMGEEHLVHKFPDQQDKISRFHTFFNDLPTTQQDDIKKGYSNLQEKISISGWIKGKQALMLLFFDLPFFQRMWIFFSVTLAIMALKQREGIRQAIWILPIVTCGYVGEEVFLRDPPPPSAMEQLIPHEKELAGRYLGHPIEGNVEQQQQLLQKAWNLYLIDVWAPKQHVDDEKIQLLHGEHSFAIARLKALETDIKNQRRQSPASFFSMGCYLIWNFFYAWQVSRKKLLQTNRLKAIL